MTRPLVIAVDGPAASGRASVAAAAVAWKGCQRRSQIL